jgi:glycosyltransferase involved in cell wall biosynthesis
MRILVALETHFVRGRDSRAYSTLGVDAYAFWRRYLEVFDDVLIAARTTTGDVTGREPVDGPGVRVVPLPDYHGPWGYLRSRHALTVAIRDAVQQSDALCLRAPGPIAGCAWTLRGNRPYAVEVVGDPVDALAPGSVRSVLRPLARAHLARELRAMCREATAVAYVTETVLQRRYPTRAWSTSYSSIDLDAGAFTSEEGVVQRWGSFARANDATAAEPWRLITVGSLAQPYKGHDVLIDAVALCRARGLALELTIVGEGRYRPSLEARATASGLAACVRFTGQVSAGSGVRDLLDRAHIFALPSRTEGLPRALLEAMARGLPCVASRVGGIVELLPEERLAPPGDARALGDTIARLCDIPSDFLRIARHNQEVARRYAAEVLRTRRTDFYRRLRAAAEMRDEHTLPFPTTYSGQLRAAQEESGTVS